MTSNERRSFNSRTPENENPEKVVHRRGFVTRHQVSGWRFLMRRTASGVALHDTRMLVDPLRTQSRSVLVGALLVVTGLAGCFAFSMIRPGGVAADHAILADRETAALYVRLGDQLHPVLNLTSARLAAGRPDNPTVVTSAELDKFARGNLVGIPGAPERMVPNDSRDADWTVCDAASGTDAGVTLIAGPLDTDGSRAKALGEHDAVLARDTNGGSWLLWDGRRSAIDLGNRAVTSALGLGAGGGAVPVPRSISAGLFNAVGESAPLLAPQIADAGQPTPYPMPVAAPIGAVVTAYDLGRDPNNTQRYYAVLNTGLQPISAVLAGILRNTDSFGLNQPPRLAADQIAAIPVAHGIDTAAYPSDPVTIVDAVAEPVTCSSWSRPAGAVTSSQTLMTGSVLPVHEGRRTVPLVAAGSGTTADRVVIAPGAGYLVQPVAQSASAVPSMSTFWISDTGVRFGISTEGDGADRKTLTALGLTGPPLPIPSSVLSQFAAGPTLSRADALVAHDGLTTTAQMTAMRENP